MTTQQEIEEKLEEFRLSVMPDASASLMAKRLKFQFGDYTGYNFVFEPTAEATFKLTCVKDNFKLDWTTRFQAHNLWNKDVAKKGNVLVSKLGIKKKVSKNWNIEVTAEVKL